MLRALLIVFPLMISSGIKYINDKIFIYLNNERDIIRMEIDLMGDKKDENSK